THSKAKMPLPSASLAIPLFIALLVAQCPLPSLAVADCVICDNYFELNSRNSKDASLAERFCNASLSLTGNRHTKCRNRDLNGCVKMTTKAWRYHIDKQGGGMREAATLIATVVTRDCAEIPPGMGTGCHTMYGAGTTKEICYCVGPGCNSAGGISRSWLAASIAAGLAAHLLLAWIA
ncbi:hypothetical protein BOX15_Mlig024112g4, partial [Macrostomum lignano]